MITGPIYLGRFTVNDLVHFKFTTFASTGAPTTLAGTPVLKAFVEGNTTPFTTGITLTVDYGTVTGLNDVVVDTSSGYVAGKQYTIVITTGTVSAISHVGYVVGHFFLQPEPADLRAVNGGSTGATASKLELAQLKVTASGEYAVDLSSDAGVVSIIPGVSQDGIDIIVNGDNAAGILIFGAGGATNGLIASTGDVAMSFFSQTSDAWLVHAGGTGKAINAQGQILIAPTNANDDALKLVPNGTGLSINAAGTTSNLGKLELAQLKVTATGGDDALEINAASGGVAGHFYGDGGGLDIEGTGTFADGIFIQGARYGIDIFVDNNGASGINVQTGNPNFPAVILANQTTGAEVDIAKNDGITIFVGTNGNAITLNSDGIGKAINALGQVVVAPTNTNDDALVLLPNGTGLSINAAGTTSNLGKLELAQLKVTATGTDLAVDITSVDGVALSAVSTNNTAIQGHAGNGDGLNFSGTDGFGLNIRGEDFGAVNIDARGENWAGITIKGGPANASFIGGPGIWIRGGVATADNSAGDGVQIQGGDGSATQLPGRALLFLSGLKDPAGLGAPESILVTGAAYNDNNYADGGGGDVNALTLTPGGTSLSISAPVESGVDLISSLKLANAANAGKTDGMAGTLVHLRNPADTLNRITAVVDSSGDRSIVTLNLT